MTIMDERTGRFAVFGGYFLGGGGGGDVQGGLETMETALAQGPITIVRAQELDDQAVVVTASMVGSPASADRYVSFRHCQKVYHEFSLLAGRPIDAFITNEAGAHSITNGWIQAALTGRPLLDAACNGRAHPTGVMGAMSLHRKEGYRTLQTAAGGRGEADLLLSVRGSVDSTSKAVRNAAVLAGGTVTVLRNPVSAGYVREHAALGALSMCMEVGQAICAASGDSDRVLRALADLLGLTLLADGVTRDFKLRTEGGFDVGSVTVSAGDQTVDLDFWNEFLTAERNGQRLATFPDLIALVDRNTGLPLCSSELRDGMRVAAVTVPAGRLLLGSTMRDAELYAVCEAAIQKSLI